MMMPGREYQAQPSRFGFNGKENDNDVKGFGSQQDYGMRIYDTRLGRFLSVDPISKQYPDLTPYQFASNTPIQAIDLDGAEAWYYYQSGLFQSGWTSSKLFSGPWTEEHANKLGYYSAQQVHKFEEDANFQRKQAEADFLFQERVDAIQRRNNSQNLFGLIYELTAKGGVDAAVEYSNGNYVWGTLIGASTFADFGPLLRASSREFSTIARGFAARFTLEQTWKLHPMIRGILIEARQAVKYIDNGFEWLSQTTSPLFRKFDFYKKATGEAISLKSVNADKNLDFKAIYENINQLAELKSSGVSVQWGREFAIKKVELHIVIPKGYEKSKLKDVLRTARNKLGKNNVKVTELSE